MRKEILHQYANSPKLVGLIDGLAEMLSVTVVQKTFTRRFLTLNKQLGKALITGV